MNILSKIILTIISFFIFFFLIFVTYVAKNYNTLNPINYTDSSVGSFELGQNDQNKLLITKKTGLSEYLVEKINFSDKIIHLKGNVTTSSFSGNIMINVGPGIYFFDLKEQNQNYIISGEGFEINNKGPGMFVLNTTNSRKNVIFSINTLLNLDLKHYKTDKDITSLDLYPHTYLVFNPIKNIFVKNSDLLKITQTFAFGYFTGKIIENDVISEKFLDIVSLKDKKGIELVKKSLNLLSTELDDNKVIISDFVNSNFGFLPGEKFINQYFSLFINPNKKSIYYQNLIIRNIHELLSSNKIDEEAIDLIIRNNNTLKSINLEASTEIERIITYYYQSVIKSNQAISTKVNFTKLINKIYDTYSSKEKFESLLLLEQIFLKYDLLDNSGFHNDISQFRKQYFEDLGVDIKGNIYDMEKTDYLLFFLENILISDSSIKVSTKDLITLLSDYVEIANSFYTYSNETVKRTGLFTNSKILNIFETVFKAKFFKEDRDKAGILVTLDNKESSREGILMLESNINKLINFYTDFNSVLDPDTNNKDKFVIKLYSSLEEKYSEYFSALKDYQEYKLKYDLTKKELLSTNSINENEEILKLSVDHAKLFLSVFNGIQLKYTKIKIMDYGYCISPNYEDEFGEVTIPYCYKIDNLNIDSNNVSFLLYPFEKNKIDDIYIENILKTGSYKLDEIQEILVEKKKASSTKENKYDFSNFLVNTFGQRVVKVENNKVVTQENILEEDPVVKIFKRNKLLGEQGDFANLNGFINISYNDLIVEKINEVYSIKLLYSPFNLAVSKNLEFKGELRSDYNFSPKHSFINPSIKLIESKSKQYLLLGNEININGEYEVNKIADELKELILKYSEISFIVSSISQKYIETDIKINYNKKSKELTFELNKDNKIIEIKLSVGKITSIKYNSIEQLKTSIIYTELNNFFNK